MRGEHLKEMKFVACMGCKRIMDCDESLQDQCGFMVLIEALHEAGYRKATEVVEDIFSDFESILFSLMYLDFDGKYHLRKMNGDRVTKIFERYYNIKKKYTEGENNER